MLRFENVGLRYGMGAEVVRDLNFGIAPQSFQFLTGPSGAGKTTLLRLMLLSLRPTRGAIHIFGSDAAALDKDAITAIRRRIGVVFQDFRLLEHLMEKPGRVFSRAQLLDSVWGLSAEIDERTVDVHVGRLRKALSNAGERDPIRTVRGAGYSFDETFGKD